MDDTTQKNNVFLLHFQNKEELYQSYMPFIKDAALFVETKTEFQLGDPVFLMIKLSDEDEKVTIEGQVVWITPTRSQGGLTPGIGVQLSNDEMGEKVRHDIETILAGSLQAEQKTKTV